MTSQLADFAKALSGPNGPNRDKDADRDALAKNIMDTMSTTTTTTQQQQQKEEEEVIAEKEQKKISCKVNNKLPKHITTTVEVGVRLYC